MVGISKKEFDSLVSKAKEAATAYYHSGEMLITDAEYDEMVEAIEVVASQNPDWDTQGLLDSVAAGTVSNSNYTVVKHEFPMLSLDKSKTTEDVEAFLERVNTPVTYEVKLDGLAVSALYESGNLIRLATRGDGESGEGITSKAPLIVGLPETINTLKKVELRGEVYMSDEDFAHTNEARIASGASPFLNPRNATAGIIRSLELDYEPRLSFACYDLAGAVTNEEFDSYKESLEWLDENGIPSAFSLTPSYSESDSPKTILDTIEAARGSLGFPIDGAVIKVNDATRRQDLGTVGKAPKWATAYKYAADTSTTILRDIEVALGRTGQMSLRAVLEPVHVAGTTITYATLHNPKFIADADIRIGDTVYVYRAGDVVPRVDKVDVTKRPYNSEPWQAPDRCVNCGSPWNKSTQLWRCDNPDCSFVYKVIYALSRSALDVDGASDAIAEALVEQGLVTSIPDIFTLTSEQLSSLELDGGRVVGAKVGAKIYQEIQNARTLPNYKFLVSLGFRTLGRTLSKRIMAKYPTLEEVAGLGFTDLVAVDGIGEEKAEIIASELANNQHLLQAYIAQGLGVKKPENSEDTNGSGEKPLEGEIVVVSGTVPGHTRDSAKELVETLGGTSASSVSSRTTLLVAGAGAGSKVEKAESSGIKVWSPEQLLNLS